MQLIDTHAHLDLSPLAEDVEGVIARALEANTTAMITIGISADSSAESVRLAEQHAQVRAAVGIHPNSSSETDEGDFERIVTLADNAEVVAIGETGLDLYWDKAPLDIQQAYFVQHLDLARDRDLPVIIHCREADEPLMAILRERAEQSPICGVLHCFSGDQTMADECIAMGLYLSFAGNVTYTNKKFKPLHEVAARVPDDRLLVETDCPFQTPMPYRGKRKNEPSLIVNTADWLAQLRGQTLEEVAAITTANARQLFGM